MRTLNISDRKIFEGIPERFNFQESVQSIEAFANSPAVQSIQSQIDQEMVKILIKAIHKTPLSRWQRFKRWIRFYNTPN